MTSAFVGSGIVKPDSHPPMFGCHWSGAPPRPRPPPPPPKKPVAAVSGSCPAQCDVVPRPCVFDSFAFCAAPRPPPPPPPRPPRPPNPAGAVGIVLPTGRQPLPVDSDTVDGPRIVPSSCRLL